ncbi:MAG: hypothetical protein IJG87_06170 [Ruminococcus sp.]|nr:hypothetical protein [Ruminococcus sp.]
MKKFIVCFIVLAAVCFCCSVSISAVETDTFDTEIRQIENSIGEEASRDMDSLGVPQVEDVIASGIDSKKMWEYLSGIAAQNAAAPMSALLIMTAVLMLAGVAESYQYSLRYTETKDIMNVVTVLFTASVVITPATGLASDAVTVIQGASTVMTVYLPVTAGIMAFSGHTVSSAGFYAAAVSAAQVLSKLAANVLSPLLNMILSLSVCAGICSRVTLAGITEALSKGFKIIITFSVSVFVAILGLNGTLSASVDNVANRAARFGLSSFIPLIGSSISEAYGTLQNSIAVLRSGVGVFVILSLFVTFVPLLIRTVLWSAALSIAKTLSEVLAVSSAGSVLHSLNQFVSALRTVLIAVAAVFIISSSVMIRLGGGS